MPLSEVWYCKRCDEYYSHACRIDEHDSFRTNAEAQLLNYLKHIDFLLENIKRS